MKGLRTQESKKFEKFFKIVQDQAERENKIFFLDSGDGNEFKTDTLEGEDLWGWLIPKNREDEFTLLYEKFSDILHDENSSLWDEFYCCAEWNSTSDGLKIKFEYYDKY